MMEQRVSAHGRFEREVMPHLDAAYNLARWLTRDPDDAEDVVQDAACAPFAMWSRCAAAAARRGS